MENKTLRERLDALNIQGWNYEKNIVKTAVLPHLETLPDEKNAKICIIQDAVFMQILGEKGDSLFRERYSDVDDAIAESKALKNLFIQMGCEVKDDPKFPNDFSVTF